LISSKEEKDKLLFGSFLAITILSGIGVFSYLLKLQGTQLSATIDGVYRMQSVIGYANTTAVFCGVGAILSFYYREKSADYKFLYTISLVINLSGLLATKSRFGIVCFIISIIIALSIKFKKIKILTIVGLVLGFIMVVFLYKTGNIRLIMGSTVVSRLIYYYDAIGLFSKNIFGVGVYGWENKQYLVQTANYSVKFVHNGFLQIALDGGVLALIGLVYIIFFGFYNTYKMYQVTRNEIYLYLICILSFIVLHSLVDLDFTYAGILFLLGLVISFNIDSGKRILLNKYFVISLSLILIFVGYSSMFVIPNEYVTISTSFNSAYNNKEYEKAYEISKIWIEKAPRQQNAFDAYYITLEKLLATDDKYKKEMDTLHIKVNNINSSMNLLSKYIGKYSKIVLPE
jgi:hypothetical protein